MIVQVRREVVDSSCHSRNTCPTDSHGYGTRVVTHVAQEETAQQHKNLKQTLPSVRVTVPHTATHRGVGEGMEAHVLQVVTDGEQQVPKVALG